jgi:dsRNA-specific ribonuclease
MKEMRTLQGLEERLGVSFHDKQLLRDATTHDSAVQERLAEDSYERLGPRPSTWCMSPSLHPRL